jgi:hypothetical protein
MDKSEFIKGLESRSEYFEHLIETNVLFKPEFDVSVEINSIIKSFPVINKEEAARIIGMINGLESLEHYNGSGWFDYKIQLSAYLKFNGFDVEWLPKNQLRLK